MRRNHRLSTNASHTTSNEDDSLTGTPTRPRIIFLICLVAAVACIGRFLPILNLEFDGGHESMLDGRYYAGIQRGWLKNGCIEVAGRPILTPIPTTPVSGKIYANHPPLAHYILRLFVKILGFHESTFRIMGLVFTLTSLIALLVLCGRTWGSSATLFAGGIFLALPVTLHHGMSASYAPPLLAFGLLGFYRCPKSLRVSWTSWLPMAAFFFLAAFTDWAALFYLPGVILVGKERLGSAWRPFWVSLLSLSLGFLAHILMLTYWLGDLYLAIAELQRVGGVAMLVDTFSFPGFWHEQVAHWGSTLTWPGAAVVIVGVFCSGLRVAMGRMDRLDALNLAFFMAAFGKMLAFPIQAHYHDFWWYSLVVCATLSGAKVLTLIWNRQRVFAVMLILGFMYHGTGVTMKRISAEYQGRGKIIADSLNSSLGANSLVVIVGDISPMTFYLSGWPIDGIRSTDQVVHLFELWNEGEFPQTRFALIAPKPFDDRIRASQYWHEPEDMHRETEGDLVITWVDRRQ